MGGIIIQRARFRDNQIPRDRPIAMGQGLQAIRSWYGLKGEIYVEQQLYHLGKVGPIPLIYPPLANRFFAKGCYAMIVMHSTIYTSSDIYSADPLL